MCLRQLHSDASRAGKLTAAQLWPAGHRNDASPAHVMHQSVRQQPAMQMHSMASAACATALAAFTRATVTASQWEELGGRHARHGKMHQSATRLALLHAAPQPARFSTATMGAPPMGQHAMGSDAPASAASLAPAASQGPGAAKTSHPDQPAGATAAGLNAWWDDDGCFEYRAPLSTTVRRLKVNS